MPLSTQQVEHIARLARLNLTPEEIAKFTVELTVVLEYIDQLKTVKTDGVDLAASNMTQAQALRDDKITPSLPQEIVVQLAPQHTREFILVPKVIG
jgi:aspartyl-tRNA(Asn)/glutamyl-tRNA(Gln) amidotransferase subunit C